MAERPIIFSAEMVRAILDGRKTQTRRVLKPASVSETWPGTMWPQYLFGRRIGDTSGEPEMLSIQRADGGVAWSGPTPYAPGDVLWVKETWADASIGGATTDTVYYQSTPDRVLFLTKTGQWREDALTNSIAAPTKWRSPRYMPRWASRISLLVTEVRVQRLQDITEEDAIAEGLQQKGPGWFPVPDINGSGTSARAAYALLWNRLNAKRGYPWGDNPWVAAIAFERVEP